MKLDHVLSAGAARSIHLRLGAIVALLIAELLAISFSFDAVALNKLEVPSWIGWLAYTGDAAKIGVVFVAAFIVGIGPHLKNHFELLVANASGYSYVRMGMTQLIVYALFFYITHKVFAGAGDDGAISNFFAVAWLVLLPLVIGLWLLTLSPISFWLRIARDERRSLAMAGMVALAGWFIALYAQQLWAPLSEVTFVSSSSLLSFVYPDVVIDAQRYILGTPQFRVHIGPQCSGYEGIGLVVVFTTLYLSVFRGDFKFPQALLLFPLGIVTIWCFNVLRIVVLIIIGHEVSPEIAVGGFHSQAGWISFILVVLGLLALAYKFRFFSADARQLRVKTNINTPVALLIPVTLLLATTLLTAALTADITWLYPVRVVAVAGAVILLWRHYDLLPYKFSPVAVLAGGLVFVIWLALIPVDEARNELVSRRMLDVSGFALLLWFLFRIAGAVITVPLAEELAFRGYLIERLGGGRFQPDTRLAFSWIAWLGSSLLFGLLHNAWFAGMIAGLVYGLVRYHRDKVADAIVAHAVTNLLLTCYVISTGNWSLW